MNRKTVRIAELQDESPSDYDYSADDYAPDPRASQRVAAQKRAQSGRPAHDTEPITPIAVRSRSAMPFGIGALVVVLLMIGMASYSLARLSVATPLAITPGPSTAAFLAAPTTPPAPTSAPPATIRTIGAYAAPDGVLLGQIEMSRMRIPIAHCGADWAQSDVDGSGLVWIRRADVSDLPITGPDLCAPAPQTGQGLTIDTSDRPNVWTPPEATTAPSAPAPAAEPTATTTPEWPASAPAQVADFEKPDIKDRCKFVDCLGRQAVDLARAQACHALYWVYGGADSETIPEPDLSAVRGCIWEGLYR